MAGILEAVCFLARSKYRVWLLERLRERERVAWEDLRSECNASRVTLQRNLDALQNRGWIRTVEARTYGLTTVGDVVIENFSEFVDAMSAVDQLHPFLRWYPAERFSFDVRWLADAELTTTDPNDPYAPLNEQINAMQSADVFRWLLPAVGPQLMRAAHDCIVDCHERHELVIDPNVAELLCSTVDYADPVEGLLASDRCDVLVAESEIPFYLGLTDEVVQVGVTDDESIYRALVETADDRMRDWASRIYEEYRCNADDVDVEQVLERP